jgi:hypothetical protein
MSSNLPPKFPSTPVFIPAYWNTATTDTLTQDQADARYLKFPTGQGTESIPNLIVSGTSTLGAVSLTSLSAPTSSIITSSVDNTDVSVRTKGSSFQSTAGVLNLQTDDYPITKSTLISMNTGKATITTTGTGNDFTFVNPPIITNAPATADNTTKVPTTAWVNTAITNTIGYTYTNTQTISGATTINFPNCFNSNANNSYIVSFVFALSTSSSYPTITMTFSGLGTPTYYSYKTSTTGTVPNIANTYSSTNGYVWLYDSFFNGLNGLANATARINFWGMKSASSGAGNMLFQYSGENWGISNPGAQGQLKTYGRVDCLTGYPTGITLTSSVALTGSITIYVASTYA